MSGFELLPEGGDAHSGDAHPLVWGTRGGDGMSVQASVDPWVTHLGTHSEAAVDLVRVAAAAYIADRLTPRRAGFSRTLRLHVQVLDSAGWEGAVIRLAEILHWLTGDTWYLELSNDGLPRPDPISTGAFDAVALMSGGLDSFCGALAAPRDVHRLLVGHWDNPTVKAAQDRSWAWVRDEAGVGFSYRQIRLTQAERKLEASTRSRALLFIALAVAAADGIGASHVEIPENGFTSLNPPLGPDRGGALSTRSTHPWTLCLIGRLLDELGIDVELRDPHFSQTKGELLSAAVTASPTSMREGVTQTLSCGKLDGRVYRGGNPNHHCGLCVPCLVRRGAFVAASMPDDTPYLVETLSGNARNQLLERRRDDVGAVRLAIARGINDVDLMAIGPFPANFDFEAALELCNRGLRELATVPLP